MSEQSERQSEVSALADAGAFITGRNMFSPDRGEWDLDISPNPDGTAAATDDNLTGITHP